MSRHRLAHATNPKLYFIVGYDRPVGAYFVQKWHVDDDDDMPRLEDDCFDLDNLEAIGAKVPDTLRETLIKEASGAVDPNYCKDWM